MRGHEGGRDEADELEVDAVGEDDERVGGCAVGVEAAGGEGEVLGEEGGDEGEVGGGVYGKEENEVVEGLLGWG